MKKQYNVTLDKDLIIKVKEKLEKIGAKLSPLINVLLKNWVKK